MGKYSIPALFCCLTGAQRISALILTMLMCDGPFYLLILTPYDTKQQSLCKREGFHPMLVFCDQTTSFKFLLPYFAFESFMGHTFLWSSVWTDMADICGTFCNS